MSLRKKGSKMDILGSIPDTYLQVILKVSVILIILNSMSVALTFLNPEGRVVAVISLGLSLIPAVGSYLILKMQRKRKDYKQ